MIWFIVDVRWCKPTSHVFAHMWIHHMDSPFKKKGGFLHRFCPWSAWLGRSSAATLRWSCSGSNSWSWSTPRRWVKWPEGNTHIIWLEDLLFFHIIGNNNPNWQNVVTYGCYGSWYFLMGVQQSKIEWFHANKYHNWLVGWKIFYFSILLGIITPTDELIFFRGVRTTNQ